MNKNSTRENSSAKVKNVLMNVLVYAELILVAVIVLMPVVWILASSLNDSTSLAKSTLFPTNPTLAHYRALFEKGLDGKIAYVQWYKNTFYIAIVNMVGSVIISTLTSYVMSRFKFKGRMMGLMTIMVLQMFPSFLSMTALYVLFLNFGMLDKLESLILIYIAGQIPYSTWLMKGYLDGIPKSLDEAASIDGASKIKIFYKIILPLAFPMITFLAISQFMAPWMDYIFPRLLLTSNSKKTLAIGLFDLINGATNNNFTQFAAGAVLVAVPFTILYVFLQKYIVQGLTSAANKE